jgi:uncharacterized membrane protein
MVMESQRGENLGAVGQGIVTGFLLLFAYYLMAFGIEFYTSTGWIWAISGLFVLSSVFMILSVVLLVQRQQDSKNLLVIGSLFLLLLVIVVAANVVRGAG